MVIKRIATVQGFQQQELGFPGLNAGFLPQFPDNGLAAGFSGQYGATGIFPQIGADQLLRGAEGQQKPAMAIGHPDTGHQNVFARRQGHTPPVQSAGRLPVAVVYIQQFQLFALLHVVL